MDGVENGAEEQAAVQTAEAQGAESHAQEQALSSASGASSDSGAAGGDAGADSGNATEGEVASNADAAYRRQIKERDEQIAELRAQVAEAAKSAEKEAELNKRIADLEARAESERIDYELTLAGCRSTRAGRVLLEEHDGDVSALKEAEPWLFAENVAKAGVTGLPNAGAARSDDATIKRWREIAGLDSDN